MFNVFNNLLLSNILLTNNYCSMINLQFVILLFNMHVLYPSALCIECNSFFYYKFSLNFAVYYVCFQSLYNFLSKASWFVHLNVFSNIVKKHNSILEC